MSRQPLDIDLTGRVALVTGANSGMGKETARELARMGAEVILGCHSMQRGEEARNEITESIGVAALTVMELDLASLASVRSFAATFRERFRTLDVLVNNAAASVPTREITPEGFERHWAANVLGPHVLTTLLIPGAPSQWSRPDRHHLDARARRPGPLGHPSQRRRYSAIGAYRASKQASRMLTWALIDKLKAEPITANAVNPRYVLTPLTRNAAGSLKMLVALTRFAAHSPVEGADTAVWAAASPELEGLTGKFWNKRHETRCRFRNRAEIKRLCGIIEHQLANAESGGDVPVGLAARE